MVDNIENLNELIFYSSTLQTDVAKLNRNPRSNYAFLFLSRQLATCLSIKKVICVINKNEDTSENSFPDFPSGYALLRVLYENYLNTFHSIKSERYKDCKNLIIYVMSYHADRNLYSMNVRLNKVEECEFYQNRLVEMKSRILEHESSEYLPIFLKNYLSDDINNEPRQYWHNRTIDKLAQEANIHLSQHKLIYKILCEYSHSGGISYLDLVNLNTQKNGFNHIDRILTTSVNYLSQSLQLFDSVCKVEIAEYKVNINNNIKEIIEFYSELNKSSFENG